MHDEYNEDVQRIGDPQNEACLDVARHDRHPAWFSSEWAMHSIRDYHYVLFQF